jgi:signal transduction histidine kinase
VASPPLRALAALLPGRRTRALERGHAAENERLKAALAARSQEKERLQALLDAGGRLAEHTEVEEVARAILDEVAAAARAEFGMLHVRRSERYTLAATRGLPRRTLPGVVEEGVDPPGVAVSERRTVTVAAGTSEQVCAPLIHRGRPLGVLTLLRSAPRLDAGRQDTVDHLLRQGAASLANALAYEEVRRQAVIVKAVLDAARDPIRMIDRRGHVLLENSAARDLRHNLDFAPDLSAGELAALTASLVEDPESFLSTHRAIATDDAYAGTDEYRFVESGHSFERYTAPVVAPGGDVLGRILVHRDVTAERATERLKDEFVALVSHELRTPLTSIIGYVETLLDGEVGALSEEQIHFLRVVDRNAGRLLALVGDLLFVANLDAGAIALEPQELELTRLVAECVEAARPDANGRDIALELEMPVTLPAVVADAARIGQVVDNLITNALKFTPRYGRVTVRVRATGPTVAIDVEDTGIGIAESEQGRLFERFYRAPGATARAIPGSGLGLSVARAIVEGHGGTIAVRSGEGLGSTFTVELPPSREVAAA